jgi:hypothetical protein
MVYIVATCNKTSSWDIHFNRGSEERLDSKRGDHLIHQDLAIEFENEYGEVMHLMQMYTEMRVGRAGLFRIALSSCLIRNKDPPIPLTHARIMSPQWYASYTSPALHYPFISHSDLRFHRYTTNLIRVKSYTRTFQSPNPN